MTGFQSISDFFECFSHKPNSQKNKLDRTNDQSRRVYLLGYFFNMSIETAYLPSPKPRRGDMYRLKIAQTLVMHIDAIEIFGVYMENGIVTDTKNDKNRQPAEEIRGTTVRLEMESPARYLGETPVTVEVSGGSGFFVERDKIVTNFHVVEGATEITAKRVDTETVYTIEGITAFDVENDLVVLKIAEEDTPFLLGDSEIVRKGEQICAVGYLGKKGNRVAGTVRGIRNGDSWLRIKAPLKPGWSGCPVLNNKGEVIAVHSAGSISPNICYAVPSNTLKALLHAAEGTEAEPLHKWQKHPRVLAALEHEKGKAKKKGGDYKGRNRCL